MTYRGVTTSLEAEKNLHSAIFAIRLVDHFVSEHGRWPRSWAELEEAPFDGDLFGNGWPAASAEVQRHVQIEFEADPREVARQDPMSFNAIRPIGPYFEYRDYCDVQSLQVTIRKSSRGAGSQ